MCEISISIYNSHYTLKACIDSVLSQTYKNIEILLIDDGSDDISPEICMSYCKSDNRIKYYRKKNEGVALARNYGLKKAIGDYIAFVDSDDCIEAKMIEYLVFGLEKCCADISMCYFSTFNNYKQCLHNNQKYDIKNNLILENKKDIYSLMVNDKRVGGYIWNKMYIKSKIDLLDKFFEGNMLEDYEFNCRYIEYCNVASVYKDTLYNYYENLDGLTGSFKVSQSKIKGINTYNKIIKYYNQYDIDDVPQLVYFSLKYEFNINYKSYKLNRTANRKFIDKKKVSFLLHNKKIPFSKKIYILLSYMFPIMTSKIKHIISKK